MKKFRWQLTIVLLTGLIVGLLLLLQRGNIDREIDATPNPISGGIYTEALVGKFLRLNPFMDIYNSPDHDIGSLIFSGLVRFDSDGSPLPDLAESWGIGQDGTVYTFSLRENLTWHDGAPVTTKDVAFTAGLFKSGNALIPQDLQLFWSEITFEALSDNQIKFSLPEAFSPFLDYMAFRLLPEHLLGGLSLDQMIDHPFNLAPIGCGPYKFNQLLLDGGSINGVVLDAFDSYYSGSPYISQVVFMYYEDEVLAWQAVKDGEADGIGGFSTSLLNEILAEPKLNLYSARGPEMSIVFLNLNNPKVSFFQDAKIRRALLSALDRQNIIDNVYYGQAILANGPIMPGNWAYYSDIQRIEYSPEASKQSFASLGYSQNAEDQFLYGEEGNPIAFDLLVPDTINHRKIAQHIIDDWTEIGVNVNAIYESYENVIAYLENRDYEAALVDIDFSSTPDPDPYPFWGQAEAQGGQNYSQWSNRPASEFLEQARITLKFDTRERLYRNFQVLFQEELPSLPLFYPVFNYAVRSNINGISVAPLHDNSGRLNTIENWYILAELNSEQE